MPRLDLQKVLAAVKANLADDDVNVVSYLHQLDARAEYAEAFRSLENDIECGMCGEFEADESRASRLDAVEEILNGIDIDHNEELNDIATSLESKLEEIIHTIRGHWRGAGPRALPAGLGDGQGLLRLLRPVAVRERRLLFVGRIESLLFHFGDQGRALTIEIRNQRIAAMKKYAAKFQEEVFDLSGHLLVDRAGADAWLADQIARAVASNARVIANLEDIVSESDEAGLASLLQANGAEIRNQFSVAAALACLTVYGNVSIPLLRKLLELKDIDYLSRHSPEFRESREGQADLRRMTRHLDRALGMASKSVAARRLHVEPVLVMFKYDPAFGRGATKGRHDPVDGGVAEHSYLGPSISP